MVRTSKEKPIKAKDVLACGSPSVVAMETALVTLAHLALYSEEIETEVQLCSFVFSAWNFFSLDDAATMNYS